MFEIIYFSVFLIKEAFELFLDEINIRYSTSKNIDIPNELKGYIDANDLNKTKSYLLDKSNLSFISNLFNLVILLVFLLFLFPIIENILINFHENIILQGILFFLIFGIINYLINIPFSIYSIFKIEEKYGFNKTTSKIFIMDSIKKIFLSFAFGIPLLYGVFRIIIHLDNWWIYLFIAIMIVQFITMIIVPKFILPLFNKFTILKDEELKRELIKISNDSGFDVKKIFIMDASKRTKHSNAFFTGIGRSKKIVLYDTLFENHSKEEIIAIFAHEAGHFKHNHIKKMLLLSTIIIFTIVILLFLLLESQLINTTFNVEMIYSKLIYSLIFISSLYSFFDYIFNYFSRKNEFQADDYSTKYIESKYLINALIKIHKSNLSNLNPHPFYSKLKYSHPPLIERINNLKNK